VPFCEGFGVSFSDSFCDSDCSLFSIIKQDGRRGSFQVKGDWILTSNPYYFEGSLTEHARELTPAGTYSESLIRLVVRQRNPAEGTVLIIVVDIFIFVQGNQFWRQASTTSSPFSHILV
jgi:hypothetical protein